MLMKVPVSQTVFSVPKYVVADMKTAYSYVRFSTPQQALGDSLRRQVEAAEQFCAENGYALDRSLTLHDKGVSAFRGANIEIGRLGEFLRLVKSGVVKKGSALCVENLDRISRAEVTDAFGLLMDLIRAGITVITLSDKRIYSRETFAKDVGELMCSIVFLMRAHDESHVKSVRVKAAYDQRKKEAKENGFKSLAWCPPWCDFDKERGYVVNKGRAAVVRRIYDEFLKGNGTFRIARIFNKEDVPRLGHRSFKEYHNTAKEWYKKTIRDFLFDKRVYGYCQFLDKEDFFPVIISKDKFNEVQHRLAIRSAARPTGGPVESVGNLFTGLVRCAHCGDVMSKTITRKTYKTKTTLYVYLVCDGARSGRGCSYKSIPYSKFETWVLDALRVDTFHKMLSDTNPSKDAEDKLEALQGESITNQKQIEKLTALVLKSEKPSFTLAAKLNEFEVRQVELSKEIQLAAAKLKSSQSAPVNAVGILQRIDQLRKTNDGRLKIREALRSIFDKITLDTATNEIGFHFKSGFVGHVSTWLGEETMDEVGAIRVKITGSKWHRIEAK